MSVDKETTGAEAPPRSVEKRDGATGGRRGGLPPTDSPARPDAEAGDSDARGSARPEPERPGPYPGPLPSSPDEEPRV
ncbi:hypothetical protein ACFTWS_38635 [Streptomyces sp. NPDC057027]|uniref:hypothetical protein n=1 Tax=Streptomyces sp. NPDC057027 TaxID=3346004 RepID=UPI00362BD06A